jgi:translation initiation factor IF-1
MQLVNKDSSPKLWDIINKMQFCAASDNIRRNYIWLSDNDWVEVRKDFVDPESESFIIVKHTSA